MTGSLHHLENDLVSIVINPFIQQHPMESSEPETQTVFKVVLNDEEQYSIWPAERDNAPGWRDEGTRGTREACLEHIDRIWTDMRPLSLRRQMEP